MEFWAKKMPAGMLLRSPRRRLPSPTPVRNGRWRHMRLPWEVNRYAPLPLEVFVAYGRWFREHLGSDVETTSVAKVSRENSICHDRAPRMEPSPQ